MSVSVGPRGDTRFTYSLCMSLIEASAFQLALAVQIFHRAFVRKVSRLSLFFRSQHIFGSRFQGVRDFTPAMGQA